MKRTIGLMTLAFLAGSLFAADSSPKDDIKNAAKKLAEAGGYSWKSTVEVTTGRGAGVTEGKMGKDGTTQLSLKRGDNTTEAVLKGDKGAIKTEDGWKSLAEAGEDQGGQQNRGRFVARMLRTFKGPAAEAEDLLAKAKEIKKADDVYSADLSEEGIKELLTRGPRRGGGTPPTPKETKGSVKFWIKDGALSKYEYNVQGKMTVGQDEREVEINRTTTVEIKDVGTTTVVVPEEAKQNLS